MGNKATRVSKEQKAQKESAKAAALASTRDRLVQVQAEIKNSNSTALVVHKQGHEKFINTAIQQVERGDKPLTKADLVAVILCMKPEYISKVDEMQASFTVKDCNALIRNIVYNPDVATSALPSNRQLLLK